MPAEPRIWNHHSRIKLRLLRRYLYMCSTIYPDIQYFETHGGEGRILFKDGEVEDGSALIAAKNSKQIKCIIMEYDEENVKKLREQLPIEQYRNVIILQGDSNSEINRILENIINRKKDDFLRKPELIINFPIEGIKRNAGFVDATSTKAKSICNVNSQFYGSEEWMDVWRKTKKDNVKSREELLNLYLVNLKKLYKYVIPLVFVESIENHPLYYVISCAQHELGNEFLLKVKADIEKWKNEDWVRQYYKVHSLMDFVEDKENIDGKKQSRLFDYLLF